MFKSFQKLSYSLILFIFSIHFAYADNHTYYDSAITNAALHQMGFSPSLMTIEGSTVKMTVFTTYNGYKLSDKSLGATIWTTLESEVKPLCNQYVMKNKKNINHEQLSLWLAKLIGLPSENAEKRSFVVLEMPVIQAYYGENPSMTGIFRPCTDPRIGPHHDGSAICPPQMDPNDTYIASDFKTWFVNTSIHSHTLNHGAPWTEYGYTYNMNNNEDHYGVSEFVVLKNTPVTVLPNPQDSSTPYITPEQYCGLN